MMDVVDEFESFALDDRENLKMNVINQVNLATVSQHTQGERAF